MENNEILNDLFKEYQELFDSVDDSKLKSILIAFVFVGVGLKLGLSREQILEAMKDENF